MVIKAIFKAIVITISLIGLIIVNGCEVETVGDFLQSTDENLTQDYLPPNNIVNHKSNEYCDKIQLVWKPVYRAASYNVYKGGVLIAESLKDTNYIDTEAAIEDVLYEIEASNQHGASEKVSVLSSMGAKPANFVDYSASTTKRYMTLKWTEPFKAQTYNIKVGDEIVASDVTGDKYVFKNLAKGKYDLGLQAVSRCGENEWVNFSGEMSEGHTKKGTDNYYESFNGSIFTDWGYVARTDSRVESQIIWHKSNINCFSWRIGWNHWESPKVVADISIHISQDGVDWQEVDYVWGDNYDFSWLKIQEFDCVNMFPDGTNYLKFTWHSAVSPKDPNKSIDAWNEFLEDYVIWHD